MEYKELQSDWGLFNYVFDTYRSFRPFLKVMHLTLYSWLPKSDPEGCKQDIYGMDSDISEDNLGGEDEELLG